MRYPRELIEEIRMQNDIVEIVSQYVPLKQKGSSYFGLCPFHHEKTPSFSVNSEKQFYYCFGCGAAGNVFGFLMEMENCDFPEAVKKLAERANIPLPKQNMTGQALAMEKLKERLFQMHKLAGRFFYDTLQSSQGEEARRYLQRRKLQPAMCRKFGLGYAPDSRHALFDYLKEQGFSAGEIEQAGLALPDKEGSGFHDRFRGRLMFPIFDPQGRVVGFGGRILGKGEPKYLNSPETVLFSKSRNLYGLNFAKAARKKELILVEGYMDMLSVYQAGFHNVVASLGTAFNKEHAATLKKYAEDIILLYDSDEAGTNAALRAIPVLVSNGFRVRVTQVPDGKDPDEFIKQNGSAEFAKLLVNAVHYISFQIACIRRKYNLELAEHRVRFATEAAQALTKLDNEIERDVYTAEISRMTGVEEGAIKNEIRKLLRKEDAAFQKEAEQKRLQAKRQYGAGRQEEKGLLEAQKNLLYLCAGHGHIYEVLQELLEDDDFTSEVYREAFREMGLLWQKSGNVFPAELVSHFEKPEEQKLITEIFAAQVPMDEGADLQKAVTEAVKWMKRTKIDRMTAQAASAEDLQRLVEAKRKLDALHITI
ncbi:DNA primase [Anaerotignum lactatifermentans]|uniref:DNA primase n=1 Tax=Anaerotignum lactatifermentans TaxID=160404 RepID=A0ABS2GAE5_9FIRM|nr:DNA primase [Anaerotignum lactatifermentans]MBM6829899.1 DNA primase [Anaerotignum lactatifermentans]MBM6878401.1 DNA primase [Anaerotignum lactatifermentans]MBM6951556.1 DNA primase [Anaerotignum lactatifermentans]